MGKRPRDGWVDLIVALSVNTHTSIPAVEAFTVSKANDVFDALVRLKNASTE